MILSLYVMGLIFILYFALSFPFVLKGYYEWRLENLTRSNEKKEFVMFGDISLTEKEAYEYAQIINNYPMAHEDCMPILKITAEINMRTRVSGEKIATEIEKLYDSFLK